jgi:hypothetical protein
VYEPRTWTNLGAIFLPGLTTARHKNQKILYENELLKAKEPAPDEYKCRIYGMQCCGSESESEIIRMFWLDPNPKKSSDSDTDLDSDTVVG